jgi:hypothetical protein
VDYSQYLHDEDEEEEAMVFEQNLLPHAHHEAGDMASKVRWSEPWWRWWKVSTSLSLTSSPFTSLPLIVTLFLSRSLSDSLTLLCFSLFPSFSRAYFRLSVCQSFLSLFFSLLCLS